MRKAGFKRLTIWVPEEFRDTFYDMFRDLRQQWADREPTNE